MIDYTGLLKAEELGIWFPELDQMIEAGTAFTHSDLACSYASCSEASPLRAVIKTPVCAACGGRVKVQLGDSARYQEIIISTKVKTWIKKNLENPASPSARFQELKRFTEQVGELAAYRSSYAQASPLLEEVHQELQELLKSVSLELAKDREHTLRMIAILGLREQRDQLIYPSMPIQVFSAHLLFKEWAKKVSKGMDSETIINGLSRTLAFNEGSTQEESKEWVKEILGHWESLVDKVQQDPDVIVGVTKNLFNPAHDRKEKMILGISSSRAESGNKMILTMPEYAALWLKGTTSSTPNLAFARGTQLERTAYCEIMGYKGAIPEGALEIACVLWEPLDYKSEMFTFEKALRAGYAL